MINLTPPTHDHHPRQWRGYNHSTVRPEPLIMSFDQTHIHSLNTDFAQEWMAVCSTEDKSMKREMTKREIELYQDYLDDCKTKEGASDALGSTTNIVDNQAPALLLAVMNGDFAKAQEIAADICTEAATNYAEIVYEREQRDIRMGMAA